MKFLFLLFIPCVLLASDYLNCPGVVTPKISDNITFLPYFPEKGDSNTKDTVTTIISIDNKSVKIEREW